MTSQYEIATMDWGGETTDAIVALPGAFSREPVEALYEQPCQRMGDRWWSTDIAVADIGVLRRIVSDQGRAPVAVPVLHTRYDAVAVRVMEVELRPAVALLSVTTLGPTELAVPDPSARPAVLCPDGYRRVWSASATVAPSLDQHETVALTVATVMERVPETLADARIERALVSTQAGVRVEVVVSEEARTGPIDVTLADGPARGRTVIAEHPDRPLHVLMPPRLHESAGRTAEYRPTPGHPHRYTFRGYR
ncbi:hypothetical protein BJF83_20800 [Nocardiopsis sp. CNR-923]|uniref:hypothetical protein n=1 Tax=Nocardiopsis sp. CNR-923 TaxID=1904965 RepID=UPI0009664103|nr:hypothetical protein [Nocardiopsis sp. CNR-923]OLT26527.1 hypothetical protein BJF83_20800 [Nocardiopsis sp. CNR-923]